MISCSFKTRIFILSLLALAFSFRAPCWSMDEEKQPPLRKPHINQEKMRKLITDVQAMIPHLSEATTTCKNQLILFSDGGILVKILRASSEEIRTKVSVLLVEPTIIPPTVTQQEARRLGNEIFFSKKATRKEIVELLVKTQDVGYRPRFLEKVRAEEEKAVTSIFNLMKILLTDKKNITDSIIGKWLGTQYEWLQ